MHVKMAIRGLIPSGLDLKEYKKEWNKLCSAENKDQLNEKDRKYYTDNKERLSERLNCGCGCVVRRDSMTKHKATKKHLELIDNQNTNKQLEVMPVHKQK